MTKQQDFTVELKCAIKKVEKSIISDVQQYIRDCDLSISSDFNIAHETAEIIGDIDIYNPEYNIQDIDTSRCICEFAISCGIDFNVNIKGFDSNTASYDEDDIHYTNEVDIIANVQRKLSVVAKTHYQCDVHNQLYIKSYQLFVEPITIEVSDYDEDFPLYK